jgi:hypothetical protein
MDPWLLHLWCYRNTIPVPAHWSAKCDYLHGKRGTEKPPFQLPSYIASTDIVTQRDAIKEKEAKMSFQAKTRERVQPRIGKIDIDYQKLHVANFRQSRPTRSPPRPGPPRTVSVGALFRFSTSSPHKAAIPKPWSNTFAASTMNRYVSDHTVDSCIIMSFWS